MEKCRQHWTIRSSEFRLEGQEGNKQTEKEQISQTWAIGKKGVGGLHASPQASVDWGLMHRKKQGEER